MTIQKMVLADHFRGDGGIRTRVQTTPRRAFYTLILPLVVGSETPEDGLTPHLSSESWRDIEASFTCSRFE